jgi:YVTN family beta-propeller protein
MARRSRNARRDSLHHESLESRALLAVTASLVGSELRINLDAANDAASLRVEGGTYAVQSGSQAVGSFNVAAVASIRVTGDAAQANQSLFIKPGGVVAAPLTVNAGVEATVVNAPIVTSGAVTIDSPALTLAEDVRTSGNQTYTGLVRVADDIVLDAGAGTIHFKSQIRSTVGQRAALMEDIGAPNRLALSPNGQTLYATDAVSNFVYVVDLQAQQLDTVDLGKSVGNVAIAPNGGRLYVANPLDGSVTVLATASRSVVATINVGGTPEGMAVSADGQTLFVANYSLNTVAVVNTTTNAVTRTIPAAGSPTAVAVAPGGKLWVAAEASNAAVEFDVATGALLRQVAVGRGPADLAVAPDGTRVYVANNFDNTVSIIDTTTAAVLATVGVGSGPTEIVVSPDGRLVYVVNGFADSVTVIDAASRTVATTVPVGTLPVGIVLSSDGRTAYVANLTSLTELGNDPRSLTVRTTGTARFDTPQGTVDPLRALVVAAGQTVGPTFPAAPIEAVGGVTLNRDAQGGLYANGTPIDMSGVQLSETTYPGFLAPVAAERVAGVNQVLFRHPTGALTTFNFSDGWAFQSSNGWDSPGTNGFFRREAEFGRDLDNDGTVGLPASARRPDIDIDGNGSADLIWSDASGLAVAHLLDASGAVAKARVLGGGGDWSLATVGDFNGDGVTDLVWRHAPSGGLVLKLMNAAGGELAVSLIGGGGGWSLEATGDYDGDGRTDLIWREDASGFNVMWLMNGTAATTQVVIGGNTDWRLVSTGERFDANGDGTTDLIWRTAASGASVLWTMAGSTTLSARVLGGNLSWSIISSGDFDGDGKGDVLWREAATGGVVMHLLDNGVVRSAALLGGNSEWAIAGALDNDNDGKTDLFWRNAAGIVVRHLMDGGTSRAAMIVGGDATWRILGRPGRRAV